MLRQRTDTVWQAVLRRIAWRAAQHTRILDQLTGDQPRIRRLAYANINIHMRIKKIQRLAAELQGEGQMRMAGGKS